MAIATDRAEVSPRPARWDVLRLVTIAAVLAALMLALSFSVFFAARQWLHLPLPQLRTLIFLLLVFTGQGNVYLVRTSRHFWQSRPSRWLALASVLDILAVVLLATQGILMTALGPGIVAGLLLVVLVYLGLLDLIKVRLFRYFALQWAQRETGYPFSVFASDGGLVAYGTDLSDLSRRAAAYVDRILKGAWPGDLPVQAPTKFELVVNLKTANAQGLAIPQSILIRADRVIEWLLLAVT
jgi:hypothetical protein